MISPPPTPNSPASRPAPNPMAAATPVVRCLAVGVETAAVIPTTLGVMSVPTHQSENGADVALRDICSIFRKRTDRYRRRRSRTAGHSSAMIE